MTSNLPDFYKTNLALLEKHHPHIWKIMTESPPDPAGEIFPSPNGKLNLRVPNQAGEDITLHGETDPEEEITPFLGIIPNDSTGVAILTGMGLGYTPLALLRQRHKIRHLFVFELNPGIFRQALKVMDLAPMLTDSRLTLSIGPSSTDEIENILNVASRAIQLEDTHFLNHKPSHALHSDYNMLFDAIYQHSSKLNVVGATWMKRGKNFMTTRLDNLKSIHHTFLLESAAGAFDNIPAILVASGPSLNKNIHLLRNVQDKALVIAVDTALPALLAHGVTPHFLTSLDPQDLTLEKFAHVIPEADGVPLICSAVVTPKVPNVYPAPLNFRIYSRHHIENLLSSLFGGKIVTAGAGTVAHLNMLSAVIMGCSPIILIGQDLAYTDNNDHADHTVLCNRLSAHDMIKNNKVDTERVEGIDGHKVISNRTFGTDRKYFERIIDENAGHYINATEGGSHIKGTEVLTLREAIQQHCTKQVDISGIIDGFLQHKKKIDPRNMLKELNNLLAQARDIQKIINKTDKLTHSVLKQLTTLQRTEARPRSLAELPEGLRRNVIKIDKNHNTLDSRYAKIWQLLEELTIDTLKKNERLLFAVNKLEDSPEKYLEWLFKSIERLNLVSRTRKEAIDFFTEKTSAIVGFHKKEKKLLRQIEKKPRNDQDILALVGFYFENDKFALAQPLFEKLSDTMRDSAEVNYYQGGIALIQNDFHKADSCFEKAGRTSQEYKSRVDTFRHEVGEMYLAYADEYRQYDTRTVKTMLVKGFRACASHPAIREELQALALDDLQDIQKNIKAENNQEASDNIISWCKDLNTYSGLASYLDPQQAAEFYFYNGQLLAAEQKISSAIESYEKALAFFPMPDVHISLSDLLFTQGNFDNGIEHLQKAVQLDRSYAKFWENIGDNLQIGGQTGDAILAYEQCFTTLPENIELLKKMGDCYLALDQPEAAHEAYTQLKNQLT